MATPSLSRRHRLALAWGLLLGSAGWVAALVLAPFVLTHHGRPGPGVDAGVLTYVLGGLICHQHPARSFLLWGAPMPVCARCAGLYVGASLGAVAAVAAAYRQGWRRLGRAGSASLGLWRIALIIAAAPTAATWVLEKVGGVAVSNGVRAAAGFLLGGAVGWVAASSLRGREPAMDEVPEVNCPDARSDADTSRAG